MDGNYFGKKLFSFLILLFSLITNTFADTQLFPAQVITEIFQSPTPLVAAGKHYLVYELYVTNFQSEPITLTSLVVNGKDPVASFTFEKPELAKMVHLIGKGKAKPERDPLTFQTGITKLIYLWLPFEKNSDIPKQLTHDIQMIGKIQGKTMPLDLKTLPLTIANKAPVVISAPLTGKNWFAGNGPSNTSDHRRAQLIVNGHDYFAQRYAIDFIQIGADGGTFTGDESKNASYHCYGQNILAVADGTVVALKDDVPENVPHSNKLATPLSYETLPGNNIVLDVGGGKYACYGHLIPGSLKVKLGQKVKRGDVLAKLGNSGNSSEPHLHFHVVDKPSFIAANGVPYAFDSFHVLESKVITEDPFNVQINHDKQPEVSLDQLVLENTVMNFSE